jgi:hypothetical protein
MRNGKANNSNVYLASVGWAGEGLPLPPSLATGGGIFFLYYATFKPFDIFFCLVIHEEVIFIFQNKHFRVTNIAIGLKILFGIMEVGFVVESDETLPTLNL